MIKTVNRVFLINTLILSFLFGVSVMSFFISFNLFVVIIPIAFVFWIFKYFSLFNKNLILLILLFFVFGLSRLYLDFEKWGTNLKSFENSEEITAHLVSFPDINLDKQKILIQSDFGFLELKRSSLEKYLPGDIIFFTADILNLNQIEIEEGFIGRFFLLKINYLAQNIGEIKILNQDKKNFWLVFLREIYQLRLYFLDILNQKLGEPSASFIAGILIGERGSLSAEINENFRITGLTHILAVSGFNITIIINLILFIFLRSSKTWRFWWSFICIFFFVVITGASASVLRAGVMGILALFVKTIGRKIKPLQLILLSVFLIVVVSPAILNFDISFQLSVVATLSLIIYGNILNEMQFLGWKQFIWESVSVTLAAQILTLPLIFFYFGSISLISPVANLVVGPLIPFLMLMGAIIIGLHFIFPFLIPLFAGIIQLIILILFKIIDILAHLPFAQIDIGKNNIILVVFYYLLLFKLFDKQKLGQN